MGDDARRSTKQGARRRAKEQVPTYILAACPSTKSFTSSSKLCSCTASMFCRRIEGTVRFAADSSRMKRDNI
jgi:hypothetical protein